jgi:hypothetical protein
LKCDAARARLMAKAEGEGKMVLSVEDSRELYCHGNYLSSEAPVVARQSVSVRIWQDVAAGCR